MTVTKELLVAEINSFQNQIINAQAIIEQAKGGIATCKHFLGEIIKAEEADKAKQAAPADAEALKRELANKSKAKKKAA